MELFNKWRWFCIIGFVWNRLRKYASVNFINIFTHSCFRRITKKPLFAGCHMPKKVLMIFCAQSSNLFCSLLVTLYFLLKVWWNWPQVSISPTFYEQLLCQNPFAKNYKLKLWAHKSSAKKLWYKNAAHKILVILTIWHQVCMAQCCLTTDWKLLNLFHTDRPNDVSFLKSPHLILFCCDEEEKKRF
jgi:hypothetical protein